MEKTFCIFGDSVTQAAYVENGWVDLLRIFLENKYQKDFVNVFNLGISGNTTSDVLNRLVNEAKPRRPTDIIFAIGVNDLEYSPNPDEPVFKKLITLAKHITNNVTFVGLVSGGDSIERVKADNFDRKLKDLAEADGCRFIQLLDKLNPGDFSDGLHPNQEGHRKMFEAIKRYY